MVITDENTHVSEPAFETLCFSFVSTTFWVVPIQCGSVMPTTHKVTNYSLPNPFLLLCRANSHLAMLEIFQKNHIHLADVCGKEQLPTMYAPFVRNWWTLLLFLFKFAPYSKLSLVCRFVQVVVHPSAPPPFERGNTELLGVISLSPYFKSSS